MLTLQLLYCIRDAEWLAEPAATCRFSSDILWRSTRLSSAVCSCSIERWNWHATPACNAPCWAPTGHAPWLRVGVTSHEKWAWNAYLQVLRHVRVFEAPVQIRHGASITLKHSGL